MRDSSTAGHCLLHLFAEPLHRSARRSLVPTNGLRHRPRTDGSGRPGGRVGKPGSEDVAVACVVLSNVFVVKVAGFLGRANSP